MTATDPLYGLVLAGGESRRMGSDKALLQRDGGSQLEFAVALLRRHLPQVFVSVRDSQADDAERSRYPQVVDRYSDLGPLAGVLSAMDASPDVSWLVMACDLPNVDDRTIEILIAARADAGGQPFIAYRSSHDGLPEPLCSVYGPGSRKIIDAFIADGISCPRKIMIRSATLLLEQATPDSLDNMNRPEDLDGTGVRVAR